jgi:hypothetical protein
MGARRASSEQIYLACAASPANPLILASAASTSLLSCMGQAPKPPSSLIIVTLAERQSGTASTETCNSNRLHMRFPI